MSLAFPTGVLRQAREEADITQADLAAKLGVSGSVISRLEKADATDPTMAKRYLDAVGTRAAGEVLGFYSREWHHIERPSFNHPDREELWRIEETLSGLERFEHDPSFDPILDGPLKELRARLKSTADYLARTDHAVAWIGDIGVGKTTALSLSTNITLRDKEGKLRSVFPTGGGRMTTCEVVIKVAPAFGIAVDSLGEEEIRLMVAEFVTGLKKAEGGVSTELERVIRNMADLKRQVRKSDHGQRLRADPVMDLLQTQDVDQVVAYIIGRMNLPSRTQTQMILSEAEEGGLQWLAENIGKINHGQHPGFSVPQRITVLLPSKVLRHTAYDLSVIDTKGVEGTTQRPDLQAQWNDARTLAVLCCRFNDAPGATPLSVLREIVDGGSDAIDRQRLVLLILPREGEAMEVHDDEGQTPSSIEEAYLIKEEHVARAFASAKLPNVPVLFLNAATDDPQDIWTALCAQIAEIRRRQIDRAARLREAAHELITNADVAKTRQARRAVAQALQEAVHRHSTLPGVVRPAHRNLVEQIGQGHQSSIAAAVNRRGGWHNFPMHHMIGVGVRNDANLRTRDLFVRLDEQISSLEERYSHLADLRGSLSSLKEDLEEWRQEFLNKALSLGKTIFQPHLDEADDFWRKCRDRYGAGSGYRRDIAEMVERWFEDTPPLQKVRKKVDASLQREWKEVILDRLLEGVRFDESGED